MTTAPGGYIVDDRPSANRRLARLLEETGRVEVVGSATQPHVALAEIPERSVSVLFVGLALARLAGCDLLKRVPPNLRVVVMLGGHQKDEGQALAEEGIPCAAKPLSRLRLHEALDALGGHRTHPDPTPARVMEILQRLPDERARVMEILRRLPDEIRGRPVPRYLDRVAVHVGGGTIQLIEVAAISHFAARGGGTVAMTPQEVGTVRRMVWELEERLDPRRFVRIDRAVIVNLDWVERIDPGRPGLLLTLKGHPRTTLKVARDRMRGLRERFIL